MIETIAITSLVIPPNRQRREFDPIKVQDLAEKIHSLGLFHPIVVRNDGFTLVAGERRVKAIEHLYFLGKQFRCGGREIEVGALPVVKLGELSPIDVFEAELTENVVREDLTWRERAEAMAKLAELRGLQQGAPVTAAALAEEIHGRSDGGFQGDVRQALIVAKHLDNPVLKNVTSLRDAFKVLKMDKQKEELAAAGAKLPSEVLKGKHRLLLGDFRDQELPLSAFAVTLTDPEYGIGADSFAIDPNATAGHTYSDSKSPEEWQKLMWDVMTTARAVGMENSHHYLFCDLSKFYWLKKLWEDGGFRVWNVPFIMYRKTSIRAPWQECGPWKSYECILYAMKGRRPCNMYRTDVIECRGDENLGHGAQKPVSVYVDLLERSTKPGEQVIDFCCGSGTIFPAAHQLKLIATGCEIVPQNAAIAAKRLEELK